MLVFKGSSGLERMFAPIPPEGAGGGTGGWRLLLVSSVLLRVRGDPPLVTVDLVEVEELLEGIMVAS